ncbi:CDP-diacylglycerol--glycerol-3-phosphate 3-phosphatidyltransferase [Dermatophagoides farinae]|uniref:CDP-diacylglycerol--glycerol-3-phosphate 3-phosphatidyltransferase n=1 Tax=Dermatophagoides farinae TaxID=6954 RepID=A0A922HQI4_DERFA|nr:CDP-diacylglycerol--glycerol-3-phosphate 3-phosphatidyltransferase [Dermatophagoides farinae]
MKRLLDSLCDLNLLLNKKFQVPTFHVHSSNISVIKTPTDFYETLKSLSDQSTKRICISSLYIGTDHLEQDLIQSFSQAKSKSPELNLNILLDYNRATRETPKPDQPGSSKSILLPLINKGANVNFYLTHVNSRHQRFWQRPKWNELISLHHMKLYIFDDNIVISGANLSDLYFTNRQDRYILIRDTPALCDYFDQLIQTIGKFSLELKSNGDFQLHDDWKYDPRRFLHRYLFKMEAHKAIRKLNENFRDKTNSDDQTDVDTIVFPLLQMKTLNIRDEENIHHNTKIPEKLTENPQLPPTTILVASEEANGFYQGKGLLRYVPSVYTYYLRNFLRRISTMSNPNQISIRYYNRSKWSFHGKGIWLQTPEYYLTMVGSTNFGYRSVYRDNEAQLVIVTRNDQLRKDFQSEFVNLVQHSHTIRNWQTDLPRIPFLIPIIASICRTLF